MSVAPFLSSNLVASYYLESQPDAWRVFETRSQVGMGSFDVNVATRPHVGERRSRQSVKRKHELISLDDWELPTCKTTTHKLPEDSTKPRSIPKELKRNWGTSVYKGKFASATKRRKKSIPDKWRGEERKESDIVLERILGDDSENDENDAEDKTNDETCLMAQSSNEVTLNSSYYSDNASSLDNDNMQIEYDSLCEISLKIINKNKILKTKRDLLEKEILELNEKIKKLERSKEIEIACKSCDELKSENAKLKETQVKFVKFDKSANTLREMLDTQKSSLMLRGVPSHMCFLPFPPTSKL
ncbi:hypothetical protein Tco_1113828 [Tanacetum coccineum]|uniref:Uncharacterized protein n=1 Tax=Tanacetum coccineum TaxID=301880 RepID=A0ABQ5IUV8_9ASTR